MKKDDADPCAPLKDDILSYWDVKDCLSSFPYDKARAEKTINTLKLITQNFYVFYNQAKDEPMKGFTFDRIDLGAELDRILATNYERDLDFMMDINKLYARLRDGHVKFDASCYKFFRFEQELNLYSVVENGKQVIKIYEDFLQPAHDGCIVNSINDKPAMDAILEFAQNEVSISRDHGVRFNQALSSFKIKVVDNGDKLRTSTFYNGNEFTERLYLPETDGIEYSIICSNIRINFKRNWKVETRRTLNDFQDSKSFFENNCLVNDIMSEQETNPPELKQNAIIDFENSVEFEHAELFDVVGPYQFYLSKDRNIGIVVIPEVKEPNGLRLLDALSIFSNGNLEKLVLDLTNNNGGSLHAACTFICLFDPNGLCTFDFDQFVDSELTKKTITASFDKLNILTPSLLNDAETDNPFTDVPSFIGSNKYKRGGGEYAYSNKYYLSFDIDFEPAKSWDTKKMIILTNGVCGSACAFIARYLAENFGVKTVAIGGLHEKELSYTSFPGGSTMDSYKLLSTLKDLNINDIPNFEYNEAKLSFSYDEAYSSDNTVLEFYYRPANDRLYYNKTNFEDPSYFWIEAAKLIP